MRSLPEGWECTNSSCRNHDRIGSENSCNGGSLISCPIAQGMMNDADREALLVGRIALADNEHLAATRAYFAGKAAMKEKKT